MQWRRCADRDDGKTGPYRRRGAAQGVERSRQGGRGEREMKENILCSAQYIFYYLQSGWMFINRQLGLDLWSGIVGQFGNACRFRQSGPLCALVQFSRRLCVHRSRGGPSAVQALGRLYLTVRCGFHNPRLCGIWRSRYWRWGIREADHLSADFLIVILDCIDDSLDTCDEEDPEFGAVDHFHGFRM